MTILQQMNFLTATEVAEKLKMHPQVILRKLQSGEIPGFKLDKDWRIEEAALLEWLKQKSNRIYKTEKDKVLDSFFKDGKLFTLPVQKKKRVFVLEKVLENFSRGKVYTEQEVNQTILKIFPDFCTLRRELVESGMMTRKDGKYKVSTSYKTTA